MINELFSMKGKVALVTGGSRGLGYAISESFLHAGAKRVYITARKALECNEAAVELSAISQDGNAIAIPGDLSERDDLARIVSTISEAETSIDVLVNNAGTAWEMAVEEFPEKGWDKVMDLNVKVPFFLTQQLLPLLKQGTASSNTAAVINIGSIAAIIGNSNNGFSYGASKAAIHQLTRNLAYALAEDHVRVNAIAPGRFHSKMTSTVEQNTQQYQREISAIPLHRWGNDDDIRGAALLLASKAGAFMTGEVITVDGGTTLL